MKRKLKITLILFLLLVIYTYISAIDAIPEKVIVFKGETFHFQTLLGLSLREQGTDKAVEVSYNTRGKGDGKSGNINIIFKFV